MTTIALFKSSFSSKSLAQCLEQSSNNFQLIRIIASAMVLFGHSWAIAFNPGGQTDWLAQQTGIFSGRLAVMIFFFVSGLLVCKSYLNRNNAFTFLLARCARIFPALILCVCVCTFIIGPIFSKLSSAEYFLNLSVYKYLIGNASLLKIQWYLPGVFEVGRQSVVNGSIWTLPIEFLMYLGLLIAGLTKLLRKKYLFSVVSSLALILFASRYLDMSVREHREYVQFSSCFIAGVCSYLFRQTVYISLAGVLLLSLLTMWLKDSSLYEVSFVVTMLYGVLWFAFLPDVSRYNRFGDYSYGLYLYAYPLQQIVAHWHPRWGPWESLILSVPLTLLAAIGSWHWVEKNIRITPSTKISSASSVF